MPISREDIERAVLVRGSPLARSGRRMNQFIRELRCEAKARGKLVLPSWRWTASEDKALIDHIRRNPVFHRDFWREAGAIARGASGPSAKYRWSVLRASGVPLPRIIYSHGQSRPVKWTADLVASVFARLREARREAVAAEFNTSTAAINGVVRRYGSPSTIKFKRPRRVLSREEQADIALAQKAWAEFEKTQTQPE